MCSYYGDEFEKWDGVINPIGNKWQAKSNELGIDLYSIGEDNENT